jgi:predicted DNA-binding transcriptional regulator AlpA
MAGDHGWPRGLSAELAAEYVGLSASTIRRLADFPQPHNLTPGRLVWAREELDAWFDRKIGKAPQDIRPAFLARN